MTDDDFYAMYLNAPCVPDEEVRRLEMMAREYHELCDYFDELFLTGPDGRDGKLPISRRELFLTNRHAHEVIRWLARKFMVPTSMVRSAVRRHSESQIRELQNADPRSLPGTLQKGFEETAGRTFDADRQRAL